MKTYGVPFMLALAAGGINAAFWAMVFGAFWVRSSKIYFSMLTLAFAQIVWAVCFKWNSVTGGEQGFNNVPYPNLDWMDALPALSGLRSSDKYYLIVLVLIGVAFIALRRIVDSPFGRILTAIRENPERAEFLGINVRLYQLAAFVVAGTFAGLAGALFGIFNRGVFPDFAYWAKSAEVLIMVILGGFGSFWGPAVGAGMLVLLNHEINAYTTYWPLILGTILIVLLFAFPGGIVGAMQSGLARLRRRRDA
jgi:branched-chain amino acid transport system permease protein